MLRRRFLQLAGRAGAGMGIAAPLLEPGTQSAFGNQLDHRRSGSSDASGLASFLDKGWSISTDPANVGRNQSWFKSPEPGAKATRVPSVIQETFPAYHGVVWYWLEFQPQQHPYVDGRYLLRFNAVDYRADVWLNSTYLGSHEGGDTPFVLDATVAVRPGMRNLLSVRVLNPDNQPIDGIVLNEVPHHNKVVPYSIGMAYNYGGLVAPVELLLTPCFRITDSFLRPDWKTGSVRVQTTLHNSSRDPINARFSLSVSQAGSGDPVLVQGSELRLPPGQTVVDHEARIEQHQLWDFDQPHLYRLNIDVEAVGVEGAHQASVRFGFRDFRIVNGYFRLNGRRLLLRSTHTGNHVPFGQVVPPAGFPDLLRRDMLNAKSSGFNTIRFLAGVAFPFELDMCDELGLLVYEESLGSWLLHDSPKMRERYQSSVREMILRDRNHPCLAMWGMLNETEDGPVFREAQSALPWVRSLDDTRLVLLSSGRFDGHLEIGSASNPGSPNWEHSWGEESPGGGHVAMRYPSGPGTGDFHFYPFVPQTPEINHLIRTLGQNSKPVFLSEYGIGSMMDVTHEFRKYEQAGIRSDAEDYLLLKSMVDRLSADWSRFGMEVVYPYPETLLRMSQLNMVRHRLLGFNLIRSNPKICGFNLTGMLDHAFTGEGVWRFWRDWKPGVFDAMCDGWAPVRWCLFAEPAHTYLDRPVTLEAVLANEDALPAGEYPAQFRVWGPDGIAWDRKASFSIPPAKADEEPPLAIPVLKEEVVLQGSGGTYELVPFIQRGAAPPEASQRFYLSDRRSLPTVRISLSTWCLSENVSSWMTAHGVQATPLKETPLNSRELILVGDVSQYPSAPSTWRSLAARMATGSTVVFLSPRAFQRDGQNSAWLPLARKGRIYEFHDLLYHKECVAKPHPIFAGMQGKGILDWDYYGATLPSYLFDDQDTPQEVIAAAFAAGYTTPGGYASGVLLGSYKFGAGKFFVNSFAILDNIDAHPAADRLFLNFIEHAASEINSPAVPLPADFDFLLKQIDYPA
jgi:Glycosyl hydrolases family 2, sugar binding domain/Glycosyl hydrolases family 2, TIM barrel domain/Glycosyl hydrolases family 2